VAFVTGHTRTDTPQGQARHDGEEPGEDLEEAEPELDWAALAAFPGTLVFYMGVRALAQIAESLIAAGRPAGEPAAVIERGTLPGQRVVSGTLRTIAGVAHEARVQAPAITIVGAVAELSDELGWLTQGPLAGRTVAVTRARAQASDLVRRLEELGATVAQAPVIRTRALPGPPIDPTPYDLICLTSPNAVDALFERLDDGARPRGDARSLAGARIAAIGPGTARALREHGIVADIVPERFVAESLVRELAGVEIRRALVARAREARDVLPDALRERGVEVDIVALYETVAEPLSESALARAREADYITFTSSSTVRFFFEAVSAHPSERAEDGHPAAGAAGALSPSTRIVSIGPVTSIALREHGLEPHLEAERHDIDGLIDALLVDLAASP